MTFSGFQKLSKFTRKSLPDFQFFGYGLFVKTPVIPATGSKTNPGINNISGFISNAIKQNIQLNQFFENFLKISISFY